MSPARFWLVFLGIAAIVPGCTVDRAGIDPPQLCEALTCAALGLECGDAPDGCGGTARCGECTEGNRCENNRCECIPEECAKASIECGILDDGCGGILDCGPCATPVCGNGIVEEPESCDDKNTGASDGCSATCTVEAGYECSGMPSTCTVICDPDTCEGLGANCGSPSDGCGGTITCGGPCTGTDTCGGGGEPYVCGCAPDGCNDLGTPECGVYWNPCSIALIECGANCPSGTACIDGECESLTPTQVLINEFSREFMYVEFLGPPGLNLLGYTVLVLEGDQQNNPGLVRWSRRLSPPGPSEPIPIDSEGYRVLPLELPMEIRGGTMTMLLVTNYTPNTGQTDVDNNNNGQFNFEPWSQILDAVAVTDSGTGDRTYAGDAVLTRNLDSRSVPVRGASRIPNGVDTDTASDWIRNDPMGFGITADVPPPPSRTAVNTPQGSTLSSLPGHNVAIE